MPRWLNPIRTQQPHASAGAIVAINLLWFCQLYQIFITVNALTFTVKHFTDDTRLIALATSISFGFSFIMGPICNYLSDRIWTPLGRRRPFIILGWSAVAVAMALIPMMPSYGALLTVIIGYTLLLDMATPLEPLCMEVVPPAQRGRSMSVRLIMMQACTLFYFQILFPRFDDRGQIPDTIPLLGGLHFTGEQLIYAVGSILFFSVVTFLIFCVREVKVPTAQNIPLTKLRFSPVKSSWRFLVETFGDRRWWWIYLLYCSANCFLASWVSSPLYMLLSTDQFGYAKPDIAIMGLPAQLIGALLISPIMGWFSDKQPRLSYPLLIVTAVAAFASVIWIVVGWLHLPTNVLPNVGWVVLLGGLATIGIGAVYLTLAQRVLGWMGRAGARVWIFVVSLALQIAQGFACWLLIRYYLKTHQSAPPILVWFLFDQFRMTLKTCTDVVTFPMFFDFVPRDKMGTLSSGFGFTNGVLVFGLTNLAGAWIAWNSGTGPKDYASGYLLQTGVGVIAFFAVIRFARAFRRGEIIEYGRLGYTSTEGSRSTAGDADRKMVPAV